VSIVGMSDEVVAQFAVPPTVCPNGIIVFDE
jgi:hypothetical protein